MSINSKYLTWIFYSFLPFCLIDVINGYFSYNGIGVPLSQLYKIYILVLFIPILIRNIFASVLSFFLLLSLFYQAIYYTVLFGEDVAVLMRNAIFLFSVLAFYQTRNLITYLHVLIIKKVFIINFIVISISVLSGLF